MESNGNQLKKLKRENLILRIYVVISIIILLYNYFVK